MQPVNSNPLIPTIQSTDFRNQLGDVLNRIYYQGGQVKVARKNVTMARVVPEKYMLAIDALLANDPSLADTLALLLNEEAKTDITKGIAEYRSGHSISLEEAFS